MLQGFQWFFPQHVVVRFFFFETADLRYLLLQIKFNCNCTGMKNGLTHITSCMLPSTRIYGVFNFSRARISFSILDRREYRLGQCEKRLSAKRHDE